MREEARTHGLMVQDSMFAVPVSRARQISMRRRFLVFSSVLLLLIFSIGSAVFFMLMEQALHENAKSEVRRIVELERLKLENSLSREITLAMKMADSTLIRRHLLNPADVETRTGALEEIAGYRKAFAGHNVFWISDRDKKYHFNGEYLYTLDPAQESSGWYNAIMETPASHQLAVNFDVGIQKTLLWIAAPVFGKKSRPLGLVGTGLDIVDYIEGIYKNYQGDAELYFFDSTGEITGANDLGLVEKKAYITEALGQTGSEILAAAKSLSGTVEINCFEAKDHNKGVVAVASIPALNWHMSAVHNFHNPGEHLRSGLTVLFAAIMAVIFFCFIAFNVFVARMLEPLNNLVKTVKRALSDWGFKSPEDIHHNDEIGVLGRFLNLTILDPLTGVYNRRYLDGHLKAVIKFLSRTGGKLSLLMVDIDFFKKFNDAYGHDAGDNCLRTVSAALAKCLRREGDFIARYGGEEFVVVLLNADKTEAQIIADKLIKKVRECNIPHETSNIANYVTISIGGVTGMTNHLERGSDYIKRADKALYESKNNGRDRYTFEKL